MVPALKTPRQQHALGGVLSKMRGEILRQGPGCGPSLYDPLTAVFVKTAVSGRVRRASGATTCWCLRKWRISLTRAPSRFRRKKRRRPRTSHSERGARRG